MIVQEEIRPDVPVIKVSPDGAETRFSEASFPKPFHIGLQYGPPARGTWTIAHSTMLIPGLHQIFVCCACCLHGVVLSADELEGGAERFSMVTLTNENILNGDLEDMMIDGVTDILNGLEEKPRCVECFTSCIQHFLHIDLKVVYRELRLRFPDIDFIDGYMTPTLKRKFTPDILGRRQLLRAVMPLEKKKTVSLVVNYFKTDPETELLRMFRNAGYCICDFAALDTYDAYKRMGESEAFIYFVENSKAAAVDTAARCGRKAYYAPYSWNYRKIQETLRDASETFGLQVPDLDECEQAAEDALCKAKEVIGDTPIAIDYTATPRPLSLARLLLEHGFRVYAVYLDEFSVEEQEDFEYLREHWPDLLLRACSHYKMRLLPRDDDEKMGGVLAIGQKAAYFTGTSHFVNLIENSGLYGYRGIERLAGLMTDAWKTPKDTKSIITVKAWGCRG